jgi:hypothetical protein
MNALVYVCIAGVALVPAAAFAAGDATDASVAALEASLGKSQALEVDEVRITGDGVACIDYRVRDAAGRESRGHAVVQGKDVLRSPADDAQRFEKAWNEHCLGPKGGMTVEP